jgi:hypothetical protein
MERHFSSVCRHDASRYAMARIRRVSDWPRSRFSAPGPGLAGMPATGEERNDSNGRAGHEAENGSEWQSLAVFRQRVATRRACNCAAELRRVTGQRERARPVTRRPRRHRARFSGFERTVPQRSDESARVIRLKSIEDACQKGSICGLRARRAHSNTYSQRLPRDLGLSNRAVRKSHLILWPTI